MEYPNDQFEKIETELLKTFEGVEKTIYKQICGKHLKWGIRKTYYDFYTMSRHLKFACTTCKESTSIGIMTMVEACRRHIEHIDNCKETISHKDKNNVIKVCKVCNASKDLICSNGIPVLYQGFFHSIFYIQSQTASLQPPLDDKDNLVSFFYFNFSDSEFRKKNEIYAKLAGYFFTSAKFPELEVRK